jgi:hypothetical protein
MRLIMTTGRPKSISGQGHSTVSLDASSGEAVEEQARLETAAPGSKLSPYVAAHERKYDFNGLVAFYGTGFTVSLADCWREMIQHELASSSGQWFQALNNLLVCLALEAERSPQGKCSVVYRKLRSADKIGAADFHAAVEAAALTLETEAKARGCGIRTRSQIYHEINGVVSRLARHRFFPAIDRLRSGIRGQNRRNGTPTLAQLSPSGRSPVKVDGALSLGAHADAMLELNIKRRDALWLALENVFREEYRVYQRGQVWLARTDLPDPDDVDDHMNALAAKPFSTFLDRLGDRMALRCLDDLRAVVVRQFNRRYPNGWQAKELTVRYEALAVCVGRMEIVRHLEATSKATTAAFGLLIIQTVFNVGPMEQLSANPFVRKARRGKRLVATLAALKLRAGIEVEGTVRGSDGLIEGHEAYVTASSDKGRLAGIDIIRMYQEMTQRLRNNIPNGIASRLWLIRRGRESTGGEVSNNLKSMGTLWWPELIRSFGDDPIIGGLPITRTMLRETETQIRAARGGYGHEIAQAVADHAHNQTTMYYLGSNWFRSQLEVQIREYMVLLEASFARNVAGAGRILAKTEGEFSDRVKKASSAGLHFDCREKRSPNVEAQAASGPTCDPRAPCKDCPWKRLTPSPANLRLVWLAHKSIQEAAPLWIAQNPKRWLEIWLPRQAVVEAWIKKLRSGPYKLRYLDAAGKAEADLVSGKIALPMVI